jgi:large subunit ribosomal protein L4
VVGTVRLDDTVFGVQPNVPVMHQVVTAQLAAARAGTQSTKTRAEVSGGGKKPFKQKGTGRARQGSTRAPHWAGGGVALGPKPRSYRQKTPRKMIQLALRGSLSDRAAQERLVVVDGWPWSTPKTKDAKAALAALGLEGKVLVVLDRDEDEQAFLAFRNLPEVQLIFSGELNAYDVLCNDWVVFTSRTLPGASETMVASESITSGGDVDVAPADSGDDVPSEEAAMPAGDAAIATEEES